MEKTLPEAPSLAQCEQELIAAGWLHLHASPFWRAPNGYLFPGPILAWQMLKTGDGEKEKRCGLCGRGFTNNEVANTPITLTADEVAAMVEREAVGLDSLTREAEKAALKASTNTKR